MGTIAKQDTAMMLVSNALENNAGPEQITQLIELVKFNDKREALRAFNTAFTAAQAEFPRVFKSKQAHNSNYAPYADIVAAIRPVLDKHGLSFRHKIKSDDSGISVTCVLAHETGHSEETTMSAPPDTSGSKNNIQAIGSSVTYLKRYTLEAITGLVTTDDDTDGGDYGLVKITDEQVAEIESKIKDTGTNKQKFLQYFKIKKLEDLSAKAYDHAASLLEAKQ